MCSPSPASAVSSSFVLDVWYVAARLEELANDRASPLTVCSRNLVFNRRKGAVEAMDAETNSPVATCLSEGLVWVFMAAPGRDPAAPLPPTPCFGGPKGRVRFMEKVVVPAHQDDAVYGLLDPAHTPFVHRSPIWRGNGILKPKTKDFVPSEMGFTMEPHAPVNSDIYKLIGGAIRVKIYFRLPGLRAEYISNSKHTVLGLTALTPIDARHTALRQIFYWNSPVLNLVRPFARLVARPFLQQDVDIMAARRLNEPFGGKGMLLGDSDQQFLWYMKLKQAWDACGHAEAAFVNPVQPATLRWRT
ncbi:MAG: hypothetical protein ACK46Q_05180 [Hyphomonas sp.]